MTLQIQPVAHPARILYSMLRVSDLEKSLAFYQDALCLTEIYRETFTEGRFTLVFLGYEDRPQDAMIELTYNWDEAGYTHGSGFGHIALGVADVAAVCERLARIGVQIIRPAGPMKFAPDETSHREVIAFVTDPDFYRIELIEVPDMTPKH